MSNLLCEGVIPTRTSLDDCERVLVPDDFVFGHNNITGKDITPTPPRRHNMKGSSI